MFALPSAQFPADYRLLSCDFHHILSERLFAPLHESPLPIFARLAAERMRKPAFCASAGPAAPAGGSGAEGGATADTAG